MIIKAKSRARVGRRPQPPPPRRHYKIIGYIGGLFATYSSYMGASLLRFSHFWGHFHHGGPFYYFLLHGGGLFWACPPPPPRKFLRALMIARRVREHAPRKFFCVTAVS